MEKHLPELLLTWSDFAQSLEKLRHKTYTKNSAERYVYIYIITYTELHSLTSTQGLVQNKSPRITSARMPNVIHWNVCQQRSELLKMLVNGVSQLGSASLFPG